MRSLIYYCYRIITTSFFFARLWRVLVNLDDQLAPYRNRNEGERSLFLLYYHIVISGHRYDDYEYVPKRYSIEKCDMQDILNIFIRLSY